MHSNLKYIKKYQKEIERLCIQHKVKRLSVFGSVLTNQFSSESDIDLLVQFGDVDLFYYFDNFMGLKENFEAVFHREVDLLEEQTVKNPYLRASIEANKHLIYEQPN